MTDWEKEVELIFQLINDNNSQKDILEITELNMIISTEKGELVAEVTIKKA